VESRKGENNQDFVLNGNKNEENQIFCEYENKISKLRLNDESNDEIVRYIDIIQLKSFTI
jgi:hypothetical protein